MLTEQNHGKGRPRAAHCCMTAQVKATHGHPTRPAFFCGAQHECEPLLARQLCILLEANATYLSHAAAPRVHSQSCKHLACSGSTTMAIETVSWRRFGHVWCSMCLAECKHVWHGFCATARMSCFTNPSKQELWRHLIMPMCLRQIWPLHSPVGTKQNV